MKFDLKFVFVTLMVALILVPISFNYLFMWDSGWSKGEPSDWFTLYGNIFGGLTGGFFTYLAVLLTLNHDKKNKEKENAPRLDILHKHVELLEGLPITEANNIVIEIANIGGSLAKNIECTLTLPNIEEVVELAREMNNDKNIAIEKLPEEIHGKTWSLEVLNNEKADGNSDIKYIYPKYPSTLVGHCMPLKLDSLAKVEYIIDSSITVWMQSLLKFTNTALFNTNDELLKFHLSIKYSTEEHKEVVEKFELYWDFVGADFNDQEIRWVFKYILRSKKIEIKRGG